jgi:hypothetical protein
VGRVAKDVVHMLAPAIHRECGGTIEARGLVVGGWKAPERDGQGRFLEKDEGHFGIRVWLSKRDVERLGLESADLDFSLRPLWPELPGVGTRETRLTPSSHDMASSVTVTCEEHYQATILAARPDGWGTHT